MSGETKGGVPNIDPEFIVIIASAWCNPGGVGIAYSWDGERFNNRADAISHGLRARGSDDFNIGQTYGDDLIWFGWMDEHHREDEETMREIASSIGLTFDPRWHALEYSRATGRPLTPEAMMAGLTEGRVRLTPKMRAVLDVLAELPEDMNYMGFKGIATEACGRIQLCDVRRTTRHLWRKGLVQFGRGLWDDDGMPKGSGYCITPAGRLALKED